MPIDLLYDFAMEIFIGNMGSNRAWNVAIKHWGFSNGFDLFWVMFNIEGKHYPIYIFYFEVKFILT
jgi:hypothetical protein